jgi:hypothetical protein
MYRWWAMKCIARETHGVSSTQRLHVILESVYWLEGERLDAFYATELRCFLCD